MNNTNSNFKPYPIIDLPYFEEFPLITEDNLRHLPQYQELLIDEYNKLANTFNMLLTKINLLTKELQKSREIFNALYESTQLEAYTLQKQIHKLKTENSTLKQQLDNLPNIGRPQKYNDEIKKTIVDFYNSSPNNTYKTTASAFGISTSTLKDILNDARKKGISVRSRSPKQDK